MVELSPQEQDRRLNTPPLQGRGRGWGLAAGRIDVLHEHAHRMRREPTEPEVRLWRALSRSQLGSFKFRRQAVIGHYVADFLCPQKALIVEVDGDTHDADSDQCRDAVLSRQGFAVLRFTNEDVMRNIDGVSQAILITLERASDRWGSPHPNPSPEGEGLEKAPAQ